MNIPLYPKGVRQWLWTLLRPFLLLAVIMGGLFTLIDMPGASYSGPLPALNQQERHIAVLLEKHVRTLADEIGPRNIWRRSSMDRTVRYLNNVLSDMGYTVFRQEFKSHDITSANL